MNENVKKAITAWREALAAQTEITAKMAQEGSDHRLKLRVLKQCSDDAYKNYLCATATEAKAINALEVDRDETYRQYTAATSKLNEAGHAAMEAMFAAMADK